MSDEPTPVNSPGGKQILAYAFQEGDCVLEFKERSNGSLMVMDVTSHVRTLEEKVGDA